MRPDTGSLPLLAVILLVVTACGSGSPPSAAPGTGIAIVATAGPTCPVAQPGDPACAPRPVAGAPISILDAQGTTVASVLTDAAGHASFALPPGDYVVQPQAVEGLMGVAESQTVTVVDGAATVVELSYDTGIR